MAVRARVLAATIMPLRPSEVPAQAADCQLWPGVPGTKVAVESWDIGTCQLTSPASVEPEDEPPRLGWISASLPRGRGSSVAANDVARAAAKAFSSAL